MSFMDNIKSLFGGDLEKKAAEVLDDLIAQVKPYLSKGEASANTALQSAVSSYDDVSAKLKDVLGKLGSAAEDQKTHLTQEKDSLLSSLVSKGTEVIESVKGNDQIPDSIKKLCDEAEALLKKLG